VSNDPMHNACTATLSAYKELVKQGMPPLHALICTGTALAAMLSGEL